MDLERKPLTAERFDEIDKVGMVGSRSKRDFDEIDRSGISAFHGNSHFNEFDRSSINEVVHSAPSRT